MSQEEIFLEFQNKLYEIFNNCHYEFILQNIDDEINEKLGSQCGPNHFKQYIIEKINYKKLHNRPNGWVVHGISSSELQNAQHSSNSPIKFIFEQLEYSVNKLWELYHRPLIFSQITVCISFENATGKMNYNPLMKIGRFREIMKKNYHFTDINYVKLVYDNKILNNDNLNFLDINYKNLDEDGNDNYIYVMINDPNEPLIQLDEPEPEAPSPEPEETINSSNPSNIIQAEPLNSTSDEISMLKDRILRLEDALESIVQHLDSAYEPS